MTTVDGTALPAALRVARRLTGDLRQVRAHRGGNTVVVLVGDLVVRVGNNWPLSVDLEARCCAAALAGGVPAPRIVELGECLGNAYLVYRRMTGWPPEDVDAVRHAGAVLGRLHDIDPVDFPIEQSSQPRRRRRHELAAAAVDRCVPRPARRWVEGLLAAARADWANRHDTATHGDFRGVNLLASQRRVVGVLDWSDVRRASPESDLGQVEPRHLRSLLDGYREQTAREVDLDLVAGHSLARFLALESTGVVRPGHARRAVRWWRGAGIISTTVRGR